MKTKHTDIWAAGFFEGEGSIYINRITPDDKRVKHILRCQITNTELPLLEVFKSNYGGNIRTKKGTLLSKKALWEWYCFGKNAETFLRLIMPYFIGKKLHVATHAIAVRDLMVRKKTKRGQIAKLSTEDIAERDAHVIEMRKYSKGYKNV